MESGCGRPCMADQRCTMDAMAAGAGDNASADESCSPACIDTLQPFLGDYTRPCLELPRRFVPAISANGLQCTAHCTSPPCEPTNVGIWPTYRGKYTSPPCTYDVRLVQLNTDTWAGFGTCAFSASHSSEDAGKQAHDLHTSTTAASCPAFLASTGDQGLNTTRRFTLGNGSAPIRIPHAGRDRLTSMRGHALHVDR